VAIAVILTSHDPKLFYECVNMIILDGKSFKAQKPLVRQFIEKFANECRQ
jgi:hypothetical protein